MMKRRHFHGGETFTQCPEESGGSQHEQVAPAVVTSTHVDENRLEQRKSVSNRQFNDLVITIEM